MNPISIALIMLFALSSLGAAPPGSRRAAPAPMRDREEAAVALIRFPWQELKYEIVFMPPRRGVRAMIIASEHRIEVYARPGDDSTLLAYDIAHELGHAIDLTQYERDSQEMDGIARH